MKTRKLITIGFLLIALGVSLGYGSLMDYLHPQQANASAAQTFQSKPANTSVARIEGKPVAIQIPSLNYNLQVIPGYYNAKSKTWSLSLDKVQFATITPEPNNVEGNTFMYGHNRKQVFNTLNKIKPGALATVQTDNGHTFTYQYVSSYETNPNDDSLFNYRGAPILTLQTCSGLWYQNRQLFRFDLVGVK